jgi:hypothetical protein
MKDFRVQKDVLHGSGADDLVWRVIQPAYDSVNIYEGRDVLDLQLALLTPGQRALLALHWTVAEVSNGGFDQFFVNPTGDLADEARKGFQRIGAERAAQLLDRVLATFPGGSPPRNRDARIEVLEAMDEDEREELFKAFDQEFYDLLDAELYERADAYIHAHPSEFVQD